MRVLFLSYAYPNAGQPGLCTFNRTMIAGLAERCEVRVVAPIPFMTAWRQRWSSIRQRREASSFCAVPGVEATYPAFYYPPRVARASYHEFLWWSVRQTVERVAAEFQPDVILSYWTHPDGTVAVRLARQLGIPVVLMVGGSDVLILGRSGRRRKVILDTLHAANAVIGVSHQLLDTMVSDGIDPTKLHIVPRGIDGRIFSPGCQAKARLELGLPSESAILVSIGRYVPVKGLPDLLQACRLLVQRGVDFRCYLIGDGEERPKLEALRRELKLEDYVELRGSQSQAALAQWYRAANATVLASHSEGIPNVLLESIACGTPFVATRVGGIPEIADPDHDRLVPVHSPALLADAIASRLAIGPLTTPRRFEPWTQTDSAGLLERLLRKVTGKQLPTIAEPAPSEELAVLKEAGALSRELRTVGLGDQDDLTESASVVRESSSLEPVR